MASQPDIQKIKRRLAQTNTKYTILLVADQGPMMRAISGMLQDRYNLLISFTDFDALALIQDHPNREEIRAVMVDLNIPDSIVIEFLEKIQSFLPKAGVILLAGLRQMDLGIHAGNKGLIQKFLVKPLKHEDILDTVEQVIERCELELQRDEELKTVQYRLKQAHEITKKVSDTLDLKTGTRIFIEKAVQVLCDNGSGSILLYNETQRKLVFYASYGLDEKYITASEIDIPPDKFYENPAFTSQKAKIMDLNPQVDLKDDIIKLHCGKRYVQQLTIPIISDKPMGLVTIFHYDENHSFSENDQQFMENITLSLSRHFENARLYETAQQREREVKSINEIVGIINKAAEFDDVLEKILETFSMLIPSVQRAFCMVLEPKQEIYNIRKIRNIKEEDFRHKSLGAEWTGILFSNVKHFIGWAAITHSEGIRKWNLYTDGALPKTTLTIPISLDDEMIAFFHFDNMDDELAFTPNMLKIVENLTEHITSAFVHARMLKALRDSYEDLKNTKVQLAESERIAKMTRTFEKFVPKQFLKRIAAKGLDNIELGKAESDTITILFSDIRTFTELSETLTPQELLNFLNAYLQRMNTPIHQNHGFVDKFIGDAIMALFDRPDGNDAKEAQDGVNAAVEMQKSLIEYNQHRKNCGYRPIATGTGIHSGPVVIGTVGSIDRMDSTVLGDSVNVASRLEGLTKIYDTDIIISGDTFGLLKNPGKYQYRELDWVRVKGKTTPLTIYEIFDADPPQKQELKSKSGEHIVRGLVCRHAHEWDEAINAFIKAIEINPDDLVARLHLKSCHQLKRNPPPKDWDGAVDITQK